ncbi:unnamed protein product [Polarella glacialis]|uniref:RNA-editing substrate-binding complex 6 protein domain-containing protein n=1 Tax=Polarella glacialis TaxID=89957 RepID=A0A813KKH0_POLGL|nr:unnamed protein product [Polarella glacialis]
MSAVVLPLRGTALVTPVAAAVALDRPLARWQLCGSCGGCCCGGSEGRQGGDLALAAAAGGGGYALGGRPRNARRRQPRRQPPEAEVDKLVAEVSDIAATGSLTAKDATASLQALARLPGSATASPEVLQRLASCSVDHFAASVRIDVTSLSSLSWSLARLKVKVSGWLDIIVREVPAKLQDFSTPQLCDLTWALARLESHASNLHEVLGSEIACRRIPQQSLSSLAWSFAKLATRNQELLRLVSEEAQARLARWQPHELCDFAWAFAALKEDDPELFYGIAREVVVKSTAFQHRGLCSLAWAFAKVRAQDHQLFQALSDRFSGEIKVVAEFGSRELCKVAWSFASVRHADDQFLRALADAAVSRRHEFTARDLSDLAWATAKLRLEDSGRQTTDPPSEMLQMLASESLQKMSEFNAKDL